MARTPGGGTSGRRARVMPTLHVDLQEGFAGDSVVLALDGVEVARRDGVSTRNQIGLATSINLDVAAQVVSLKIDVPTRQLAATVEVDPHATPHVGVSIEAGQLVLQPQGEPFRYL
jgi:hypothetical protein